MKMKLWVSTTNSRHEIDGVAYCTTVEGNTRKQLFVNALRAYLAYCNDESVKRAVKAKAIRSFSKWEFMLSNSKNPGKQYGETEYWILKKNNDWVIREYNRNWRGSIHDTIFTAIYRIPNAKVKHPFAEDFMVKATNKDD